MSRPFATVEEGATRIVERFGGDGEMAQALAVLFLDDCPTRLEEVRLAVADGQPDAIRRAAHTLKGSVGTFSEGRAYHAASRLEKMGRAGVLDEAQETLDALEQELNLLRPVLEWVARTAAA